jgi:hypothetical protein
VIGRGRQRAAWCLEEAGGNEMYVNYKQTGDWQGMEMVVRSRRPPAALTADVRAALAAYDPSLPRGSSTLWSG